MNHHSDVHIIGGGLAGLTAAAIVAGAGHSVTVHESSGHFGGRASTDDRNGFRFNRGPHALYRSGPAKQILDQLGIVPRAVAPSTAGSQALFEDHLHRFPTGPLSLLRTSLLGTRDKAEVARVLFRLPRMDPSSVAGSTVEQLVDDLVGRPVPRQLLHALVRLTTYTNAPDQLSADVAVTQLQYALDEGVVYLDGGWAQLVDRLAATPGITFATDDRVTELPDGPAVIVAAGGPGAAAALTGHAYPAGVPAEATVVDVGLSRPPRHDFVLGVDRAIYTSNHGIAADMTPPDRSSLSVAAYLAPDAPPVDADELRSFVTQLGVPADHVVEERYLRRMTVVTGIATAATGGIPGRPPVAVPDRPGVFVAGDWVGPRGHMADAVLASAADAARAAVTHVERRPTLR